MKLLAIDTATEACSVALELDGEVSSLFEVCPQQHSQKLLPMVDKLLAEAQLSLKDLDFLAFGCGPGSFTGVRIASGMIQGLGFGSELPIVPISTLAAMAQEKCDRVGAQRVIACIDARMSEVYFGEYCADSDGVMGIVEQELVLAPDAAKQKILAADAHDVAGTGWLAYEPLSELLKTEVEVLYPNAKHILPLAKAAYNRGETCLAENAEPTYLRDKVTWKKLPGRE